MARWGLPVPRALPDVEKSLKTPGHCIHFTYTLSILIASTAHSGCCLHSTGLLYLSVWAMRSQSLFSRNPFHWPPRSPRYNIPIPAMIHWGSTGSSLLLLNCRELQRQVKRGWLKPSLLLCLLWAVCQCQASRKPQAPSLLLCPALYRAGSYTWASVLTAGQSPGYASRRKRESRKLKGCLKYI